MSTAIEKVREFWDRRPCGIRHSLKTVGTKEYFEEITARRFFVEGHIAKFAEFDKWRGNKVLEIGCGIGIDTLQFARNGAHVTAVDLSPVSLSLARQNAALYQADVEFVPANVEELSQHLPPRPYDLIYSSGVLHHTPNPLKAFQELAKFCAPHTRLRVLVYAKYSWKVLWILFRFGKGKIWNWARWVAHYSEAQEGSPVTYVYSAREIKKLFSDAGFRVVRLQKDFIFPYIISEYKEYRYKKTSVFRWMPPPLFRWLEKKLGWHWLIEAVPVAKTTSPL